MGEESNRLKSLIESVADGASIDWQAIEEAIGPDDSLRRVLRDLRTIAAVAEVHRSPELPDEPRAIDSESTRPDGRAAQKSHVSDDGHEDGDGERWGHLVLMQKIGEGTFGEVFHARDTWLNHAVALKLLKPQVSNRSELLHEARTLAQIRHENVVRIHGADVHDGRIGFWMEFIHGQTLADVLEREGVRSANEAAVIGRELCRALAAVHGKSIVHRDIKAKNVMREFDTGRVVLMDFGAGRPIKGTAPAGPLTGTPLYLAPELFDGRDGTPQTDIYALGVLLFNLVTGGYPVVGRSLEDLALAHLRGRRNLLGDLRPDLPDAFVRVVETMVSPDAGRRYATAASAREALEGVVAPLLPARPDAPAVLRRLLVWSAGAALVVIAVTAFGLLSTASFNLTFGRRAGFGDESPFQWLVWGIRALLSPVVRIGTAMAALILVVAAARVFCRVFTGAGAGVKRLRTLCNAFLRERGLNDPTLQQQVVTGLGVLVFAALAWVYWEPVTAFATYINDAPKEDLTALQPSFSPRYDAYARLLELCLLLYGSATFAVYRSARRYSLRIHPAVTAFAVVVPALALVLLRALPYRIVYQNEFDRVDLVDMRCYRIGERQSEVLLHCPDSDPPRNRVVASTDDRLRPRGFVESIFTPREESQAAK